MWLWFSVSCAEGSRIDTDAAADAGDHSQEADVDETVVLGTWTDSRTGLVWQNPPLGRPLIWDQALAHCVALEGGGWRMPTIGELRSLIRGCPETETGGSCPIADDCLPVSCQSDACSGCPLDEGPPVSCYWAEDLSGPCGYYWSSSKVQDYVGVAWLVYYLQGRVWYLGREQPFYVRCVKEDPTAVQR